MADAVTNDVPSNGKRNQDENDEEGQTQEKSGAKYGGGSKRAPRSRHGDSNRGDADECGVQQNEEATGNSAAGGGRGSHEVTPSVSPAHASPGVAIPPGLSPLSLPENSASTPVPRNTPVPVNHHDDTDSPSLATGGAGSRRNPDPPVIIGPGEDEGIRNRRTAPAPIYPLALEIPRISEPDPDGEDVYDHRTLPDSSGYRTPDVESGLRSSLQGHHSRAGSDVSGMSTPHSPVRFKEPITDETPEIGPSSDDRPDPGTGPDELPFPGFVPVVFRCMSQTTQPRYYCLKTITWPYPFENNSNNQDLFTATTTTPNG